MSFEGFPDEGLVFYEGLEADNSKTYWTRHKADYEQHVRRRRCTALLDELAAEFGTAKVFRPYRDVRFSNDKTPYKTHQGAVVHADGAGTGAWYVQISADGPARGRRAAGGWRATRWPGTAARSPTTSRARDCRPRSTGWRQPASGSAARRSTRVPAGYAADAERLELLRHKSLHASRSWEPAEWLHDAPGPGRGPHRLAGPGAAEHLARRQRRRDDEGTARPPLTAGQPAPGG